MLDQASNIDRTPGGAEFLLNYYVFRSSCEQCVNAVVRSIGRREKQKWLACLNPHSYAVARKDERFSRALKTSDWLIPDGIGIVYASRLLRGSIRERITGFDIFMGVHKALNSTGGGRIFFLGSTEETLAKVRSRLQDEFPRLEIAGTHSPPFKADFSQEELAEMIAAINGSAPDVLWVGLTAPKQEKWIFDNIGKLDVGFAGAIGAVFDFYAGTARRAHPISQKIGVEWLSRLVREPMRLWKRTFVSAPIFVIDVIKTRFSLDPRRQTMGRP